MVSWYSNEKKDITTLLKNQSNVSASVSVVGQSKCGKHTRHFKSIKGPQLLYPQYIRDVTEC